MAKDITTPDYEFTAFYFPDLIRALLLFNRLNAPEITDEKDEEPFIQLLRSFALMAHTNNVNIDITANESLLGTAKLLDSVKNHLKLIAVKLKQDIPSTTELIVEFSKVFTLQTNIIPNLTKFATEELPDSPQILFETLIDNITEPTNVVDSVFQEQSTTFGTNKNVEANTPLTNFDLFDTSPALQNDAFYIGHETILFNTVEFDVITPTPTLIGIWEFFDGNKDDENPDEVTNNGSNLTLDLTTLLGTSDKSGSLITVKLIATGATEIVNSIFSGGKNIITTAGLLGQSIVSIDDTDYIVGSDWNILDNLIDNTNNFSITGKNKISFDLPQNLKQNWTKETIELNAGFYIRYRVISHSGVMPVIDTIDITKGKQFGKISVTQGETVIDDPLGSSSGGSNQEFNLKQKTIIEGSLVIEIDEGIGFTEWELVENFLNSNSASKHYTLDVSAEGVGTIKFGDSLKGKIPTLGVDNIKATYRIGAEINGNVGSGTINVNKGGVAFVNSIFNPRSAIGWIKKEGSTPEDIELIKIEKPAELRTRDRGITPPDIEFLAVNFTDVNGSSIVDRALAIEETFGVKTIELVVVGIGGVLLTTDQLNSLNDFFNGNKTKGIDASLVTNHEVTSVNYTPKIIDIESNVTGGNQSEIENAMTALINPTAKFDDGVTNRWGFGDTVPRSLINSEIFNVDNVNIKNVVLVQPAADVVMNIRELPKIGTLIINVT